MGNMDKCSASIVIRKIFCERCGSVSGVDKVGAVWNGGCDLGFVRDEEGLVCKEGAGRLGDVFEACPSEGLPCRTISCDTRIREAPAGAQGLARCGDIAHTCWKFVRNSDSACGVGSIVFYGELVGDEFVLDGDARCGGFEESEVWIFDADSFGFLDGFGADGVAYGGLCDKIS